MKTNISYFIIFLFALSACQQNSNELEKKGLKLYDDKGYKGAIEYFDKAIEANPNDTSAWFNRARAKAMMEDYPGAFVDNSKAIKLNPNFADAYFARANVSAKRKEREVAIADYTKVIELEPNRIPAYSSRGAQKLHLADYEGALKDFSKAIGLDKNNDYVALYYLRGITKIELKDKEGGCADLSKAKELGHAEAAEYYNKNCVTYWDLKLVKVWNQYGSAKIELELTNRFGKHIDNFWIKASLRDKAGEYLAGENSIHFNNIRPDGISVDGTSWSNINANEIGKILLLPNRLEIEGQKINFETNYINILDNKYGIEVTF